MRKGDELTLFDGSGWEYEAIISGISSDGLNVDVVRTRPFRNGGNCITLMQSLPKAHKMDFIVQKATELGVKRVVPLISSRSIPRITPEKVSARITRWQNIAVETARQCARSDIPDISELLSFEEAVLQPGSDTQKMIFWEEESTTSIRQTLRDARFEGMTNVAVVVGPEGGFTADEVAMAVGKGFVSVSLGSQVLKVDTAVVTILSIIQYEKGMLGICAEKGKVE
jgi:16S rRNA (uracil1498-N3)-methyltransferase